ncbi:MAG TPA: 30S ribosomal protein S2 [Candidatus Aenigmarchaeota archaeon]|nr:30S ribosomal protein S2 [Candidatus Aenigmarchaeota archaeon]
MSEFLVSRQKYLATGVHIGMKSKTKDMKRFIYKLRPDGLAVLNLSELDRRIRIAAKFLSRANKILVVGRKANAHKPIEKFAEIVGCDYVIGRFMPGTLTNPNYKNFIEPDVILLTDPLSDKQALKEAVDARIPVVALCDTFNSTKNIDLVIPTNNKGKKALAMIYYLLAREILKERGVIKKNEDFKYKLEDFMEKE